MVTTRVADIDKKSLIAVDHTWAVIQTDDILKNGNKNTWHKTHWVEMFERNETMNNT